MRQSIFKNISEKNSARGKASQVVQHNTRLARALEYGPLRAIESYLVFELRTHNPRTGQRHLIEIRHELDNGNDRYNVYLDGDKLRNQWSRSWFAAWLFSKIESVRRDWS